MTAKIEFFPVDNGDMTLVSLESGRTILIDINIRGAADDSNEEMTDVACLLRKRLERDSKGRLYVDSFLLSHPDKDHCSGLINHFHLGAPNDWKNEDDLIIIREMWSSPIVFRRKKEVDGPLCKDAEEWIKEARRRANLYKATENKSSIEDGDKIQILGEDKGVKTQGLEAVMVKTDEEVTKICGKVDGTFRAWVLAPHLVSDEEAKKLSGKNHSSTVLRFSIDAENSIDAALFLTGGDAEVENWERIWSRNKNRKDRLLYDLLQAPHHCSWHSLSYDSWKDKGEKAKVSEDARSALDQVRSGGRAFIISSSKEVKGDVDPPCIRAKREYESILKAVSGRFLCTTEECKEDVLLIEVGSDGPNYVGGANNSRSAGLLGAGPSPKRTEKREGGRYA